MVRWRIYYADGSTFDSTMGDPWEAPGLGVVCIVQGDPDTGRGVQSRWDWYAWRRDTRDWWGHDGFGILDQLTADRLDRVAAVKAGRTVSSEDYGRLFALANADPDFAPRSAYRPGERRPGERQV